MVVADGGGRKGRIVGVYNRLLIPDEMRPQGPHNTWLIEKLLTVCKCVRETVGVCFQLSAQFQCANISLVQV